MITETKEKPKWYAVQTLTNHENKVKQKIDMIIQNGTYKNLILRAEVPTRKETVRQNGKIKEVEKKLLPSYVLVKMVMNRDTWYVIRNIKGVVGYVGPDRQPVPLTDEELKRIFIYDINDYGFNVNDNVLVKDGPFTGCIGTVKELNKNGVSVYLPMFDRETKVDFNYDQLEKLVRSISKY